jgi:hypothetical protein
MRVALFAALLVSAGGASASAQTYMRAGTERGQSIAINERYRLDGVIQAEIVQVPLARRGRAQYSILIADFDCARATRSARSEIQFSSRRDPVQTNFTPPLVTTSANPAVAEQLRLICQPTGAEDRFTIRELVPVRPQ